MSSSTSPEQARELAHELYAAWSLREPERIDAIFTDDGVYEDVAGGQVRRGKVEIKDLLRAAFTFAPDFRAHVKDSYDMATFLRQLGATFEPPRPVPS